MTRPELHALVDIVMDARERWQYEDFGLFISSQETVKTKVNFVHLISPIYADNKVKRFRCDDYPTFSDFTKAVKDYIKTLETK